jgi:hypothetical protein
MKAIVKILRTDRPTPAGKLADAEIHFAGGELDGLKLIGFAVWERRNGSGRVVTFPARPFTIHGERRHFALIRAIDDPNAQDRLRELVLRAYLAEIAQAEQAANP